MSRESIVTGGGRVDRRVIPPLDGACGWALNEGTALWSAAPSAPLTPALSPTVKVVENPRLFGGGEGDEALTSASI